MLRSTETASTIFGVAGRDEGALGDVRADGQEGGVEAAFLASSPGCCRPCC
jgi:hypothetical protein